MSGPLDDVKVVDLTQGIAGPYCTKFFADYGAEVIKVERPDGGDPTRKSGPFLGDTPHPEKSGLFLHLNTNKKGVTLNLKTATGKKILGELVKEADILVESYPPRTSQSLGITYEEMEKANPKLVMTSITSFGQTGPYRDYKTTEIVTYALSGVMHPSGLPEREPLKLGLTVILMQGGNVAASATLIGFFSSHYQGVGQHIDFSLLEAQVGTMDRGGPTVTGIAYSGLPSVFRSRSFGGFVMPTANMPCADGYVTYNVSRLYWWQPFLKLIEHEELLDDPRFKYPEGIYYDPERRAYVDGLVLEWGLKRTKREIMERGQALGLGITAMSTMDDIFAYPQFQERGYWVEVEHPEAGELRYPGAPFILPQSPWKPGRAPLLGEHNGEIYGDRLGYSKQDLVLLRERGVI